MPEIAISRAFYFSLSSDYQYRARLANVAALDRVKSNASYVRIELSSRSIVSTYSLGPVILVYAIEQHVRDYCNLTPPVLTRVNLELTAALR